MRATTYFRIASILLVVFAAGHTVGFLRFTPPTSEGVAVMHAMTSVHFALGGVDATYGGFYRGFGLFVTAYLLFSAALAWQFGSLAAKAPEMVGPPSGGRLPRLCRLAHARRRVVDSWRKDST